MAPARKSRRQGKPPAKLDEFICEKEPNEPRRSRRTPKLSEKLKSYMHEKVNVKKERAEFLLSEQTKISSAGSSETEFSNLKEHEAKSLLRKLSNYYVKGKPGRKSKSIGDSTVAVKRLANSSSRTKVRTTKKTSSMTSHLKNTDPSSNKKPRKMKKRKLDYDSSPNEGKTSGSYKKIRRKRNSSLETQNKGIASGDSIDAVTPVNKVLMSKLLNFGAEVAEAMSINNEAIFGLSTNDSARQNPIHSLKVYEADGIDDKEVNEIISWLEEEEDQRRAYRKRILESLRASHDNNMALYTKMLQVIQSVTSSA
ncbi:uncharacterized protein [Procambarus clarkii]|uniref:uncharacterized protein n=1 Tax=Procambarus clarkii TaxID=6728 RepID=UPI001E67600A|nr:uncharacterized protein LOC123747064 [Procambarus clarkii]XP_045585016.1 uncharacterized protein LOC123747064 [Procambarus clarkii]